MEQIRSQDKQQNSAVHLFVGHTGERKDLRKFNEWYVSDILLYMTHSLPAHPDFFRYIFMMADTGPVEELQQLYFKQFINLCVLSNELEKCVCFIASQSPLRANHFIFGIIINHSMLIINPVGYTKDHDFENNLKYIAAKGGITTIYRSTTVLQADQEGLVSCGPICVELMHHISQLSYKTILHIFEQWQYKSLNSVAINELLPESLKNLIEVEKETYQDRIVTIRIQHLRVLENLHNDVLLEQRDEFIAKYPMLPEQSIMFELESIQFNNPDKTYSIPKNLRTDSRYSKFWLKVDFLKAINIGAYEQVKLLINETPLLLNILTTKGYTPLMVAINASRKEIAKLLIDSNVPLDAGLTVHEDAEGFAKFRAENEIAEIIAWNKNKSKPSSPGQTDEELARQLQEQEYPTSAAIKDRAETFISETQSNIQSPLARRHKSWEIDVPHDNSCLFWAVALPYLLQVKTHGEQFRARVIKLFGEAGLSRLSIIQATINNYNPFLDMTIFFNRSELNQLVREQFRMRVIEYIAKHAGEFVEYSTSNFNNYLATMYDPSSWGGNIEIAAISKLLMCNIHVSAEGYTQDFFCDGDSTLTLIHTNASGTIGSNRNHYHFTLNRTLGRLLAQEAANQPIKADYFIEKPEHKPLKMQLTAIIQKVFNGARLTGNEFHFLEKYRLAVIEICLLSNGRWLFSDYYSKLKDRYELDYAYSRGIMKTPTVDLATGNVSSALGIVAFSSLKYADIRPLSIRKPPAIAIEVKPKLGQKLLRLSQEQYDKNILTIKKILNIVVEIKRVPATTDAIGKEAAREIAAKNWEFLHYLVEAFKKDFEPVRDKIAKLTWLDYCAKLLVFLSDTIMDMPYKYGRENLTKGTLSNVSPYITAKGLLNLAAELRTVSKVIKLNILLPVIYDVKNHFKKIIQYFLVNQMQEHINAEATSEFDKLTTEIYDKQLIIFRLKLRRIQEIQLKLLPKSSAAAVEMQPRSKRSEKPKIKTDMEILQDKQQGLLALSEILTTEEEKNSDVLSVLQEVLNKLGELFKKDLTELNEQYHSVRNEEKNFRLDIELMRKHQARTKKLNRLLKEEKTEVTEKEIEKIKLDIESTKVPSQIDIENLIKKGQDLDINITLLREEIKQLNSDNVKAKKNLGFYEATIKNCIKDSKGPDPEDIKTVEKLSKFIEARNELLQEKTDLLDTMTRDLSLHKRNVDFKFMTFRQDQQSVTLEEKERKHLELLEKLQIISREKQYFDKLKTDLKLVLSLPTSEDLAKQKHLLDKQLDELKQCEDKIANFNSNIQIIEERLKWLSTGNNQDAIDKLLVDLDQVQFKLSKFISDVYQPTKSSYQKEEIDYKTKLEQFEQDIKDYTNLAEWERNVSLLQVELPDIKIIGNITGKECEGLKQYQMDYEHRNIQHILSTYQTTLGAANHSISKILVIADFAGWLNDSCSEELKSRLSELLPREILKYIKRFRNRAMHVLDWLGKTHALLKENSAIDMVAKQLQIVIQYLYQNISYLIGTSQEMAPLVNGDNIMHVLETALASLPDIPKLRNQYGKEIPPTSEQQVDIFINAISLGKGLIDLLSKELARDTKKDFSTLQISALFSTADVKQLSSIQLQIRLKYDALLQALGETLGNLQQYDTMLSDIGKLNITIDALFIRINAFIPMIKEFRSARTHSGYTNYRLFTALLQEITSFSSLLSTELDALFEEVRQSYGASSTVFEESYQNFLQTNTITNLPDVDIINPGNCTFQ